MVKINEQTQLFEIIGAELKEKIECYVIGGSAMMFYGAKEDTKDVDLVFLKNKDLEKNLIIITVLKSAERSGPCRRQQNLKQNTLQTNLCKQCRGNPG